MRRPGICGATETILCDKVVKTHLPGLIESLSNSGCEIRDRYVKEVDSMLIKAEKKIGKQNIG